MTTPPTHPLLDLSPEVAAALAEGRPVVALESTIISHGMPWPQNAQTALAVQRRVREHGAVPATIAVLGGRFKAGLSDDEIERLARIGPAAVKASRRDLALLAARRGDGATTVAATMIIAALAGIRVFATGGIGGVHRGAASTMDISADLQELARTPVAVVCAGIKSILDLGLTREYLETHGVPLLGWQCDALPAFYSRDSGHPVDARLADAAEAAAVMHAHWLIGPPDGAHGWGSRPAAVARLATRAAGAADAVGAMGPVGAVNAVNAVNAVGAAAFGPAAGGGLVIANPIPVEHALPRERVDGAIDQALAEADAQGIHGKASTPFLLARVAELTGGVSLAANIQLVLDNARVAAGIAVAYQQRLQAATGGD
ncbi:MAG: hypothetical protein RLY78_856 [Pseudomonadota bacterium]